jgi:hypothetical protein
MILNLRKTISNLNCNNHNFICSCTLNIYDIILKKFNNSLEENVHILNKASQNINNTENKNVNKKIYSYFKNRKESSGITTNKFTK